MYLPNVFLEPDPQKLHDLIDAYDFGALIVPTADGGVEVAHLPFVLDRGEGAHGRLRCHVARANPIWKLATSGRPVLAVFSGPHGYVSPRWYERPGEQVPTWNYAVVHAHGVARGPLPEEELAALLDDLVGKHEHGMPAPWSSAELDPAHRGELHQQIVGLAIPIDRLEGKLKLSQNRSPADHARVVAAFRERGRPDDLEMARLMAAPAAPGDATTATTR